MPYMNDVMKLLEETLSYLKLTIDIAPPFIADESGSAIVDVYLENHGPAIDLINKIEAMLAEHKALQIGHLART